MSLSGIQIPEVSLLQKQGSKLVVQKVYNWSYHRSIGPWSCSPFMMTVVT